MKPFFKQFTWLLFFSIAMGFLEAAVVIYLRAIYYKDGFNFPLTEMDPTLAVTELLRELATLIMLLGVAVLSGRSTNQRFAFFLIAFAIWDIFYYVFLKLVLGWPESLLTWDILFLLPVPWVGPVLSPCLISLTMLALAWAILDLDLKHLPNKLNRLEWLMILGGSLTVFFSWTLDYFSYGNHLFSVEKSVLFFTTYIPHAYNWWLFGFGEGLLLSATFLFYLRNRNQKI